MAAACGSDAPDPVTTTTKAPEATAPGKKGEQPPVPPEKAPTDVHSPPPIWPPERASYSRTKASRPS
jgi:hypothetical protein